MLFPMSGLAWCCIPCPGIVFYPLCGLLCLCVYVASLHSIIMRITHALFPCSALADTTLLAGLTPGPSHWFYCVTFGDFRDFHTAYTGFCTDIFILSFWPGALLPFLLFMSFTVLAWCPTVITGFWLCMISINILPVNDFIRFRIVLKSNFISRFPWDLFSLCIRFGFLQAGYGRVTLQTGVLHTCSKH